jgi:exopolysaccharide biosynthesis polyprenyl glycosylphosphotransferase
VLYHNVQVTAHSLRFIDSIALAVAAVVAWRLANPGVALLPVPPEALLVYVCVAILAFLALGSRMRVYLARRTEEVAAELFLLCEVVFYATAIACLATQVFTDGLSRATYLAMVGAGLATVLGLRLLMRLVIRRLRRKGGDARYWLIVGHNSRAAEIATEVLRNPHYGISIAEIVDIPDRQGQRSSERRSFEANPPADTVLRVIDDVETIREIVSTRVIDEVVVTLPVRSHYDTVSRILDICCSAGISVRLRPQAFETAGYSTEVSYVGKIPMIAHYSGPSNYSHLLVKRVIDIIGSGTGLAILSPLLLVVAVAIKSSSPGPVFFRQTRVGLHGRHFEMIKFRSMVKDAPLLRDQLAAANERDGTAFKIRNDSRITPLGRWLRKYHVDELPQLWNVLVGDMSLVGPRPLPVKEANGNEWWQRRRLTMPPGLTCLWQLEDDPNMPFRDWMNLDMAYIDRWSLWLDLKLIMRTFATVLRGNGW